MSSGLRPERSSSLVARLTVAFGLVSLVLLLAVAGTSQQVLKTALRREDEERMRSRLQVMTVMLARPDGEAAVRREVGEELAAGRSDRILLTVKRADGTVVARTPGAERASDAYGPLRTLTMAAPAGYTVQAAMSRRSDRILLERYRQGMLAIVAIGMGTALLLGRAVASSGLAPLRGITAALMRTRPGSPQERLAVDGLPAELGDMARTFNQMLDRLDASFDRLSRFSTDIAHELRTPLQNVRGALEVVLGRERAPDEYREVAASCLEECVALSRLIEKLLFLARAENPQTRIQRAPVAVDRELESLRGLYEAAAQEAGLTLEVDAPERLRATVDRALFGRALANLLDNAIAHTPRGGRIGVAAGDDGGRLTVAVTDTGCGMTPDELERAGQRFFRADGSRSRPGNGLGLSIARGIATLHGGSLRLESRPGAGTCVTLEFPAAQADLESDAGESTCAPLAFPDGGSPRAGLLSVESRHSPP